MPVTAWSTQPATPPWVAYSYPPFGSLGAATTSSINPVRYTGREASDNTGLYYYRARYYSPNQSRFIQEDPLGLITGPNVYAYANNDPLNWLDPLGLCPQDNGSDGSFAAPGEISGQSYTPPPGASGPGAVVSLGFAVGPGVGAPLPTMEAARKAVGALVQMTNVLRDELTDDQLAELALFTLGECNGPF